MEQFLKIHYTYKNTSILTILHENKIELIHNGIIKTWTQYHEYFFFKEIFKKGVFLEFYGNF